VYPTEELQRRLAQALAPRRTNVNPMMRGEPDPEVVRRHIGALRAALANLRRHAGLTVRDLRADADRRWSVERILYAQLKPAFNVHRICEKLAMRIKYTVPGILIELLTKRMNERAST